jgi:hypothetical protein
MDLLNIQTSCKYYHRRNKKVWNLHMTKLLSQKEERKIRSNERWALRRKNSKRAYYIIEFIFLDFTNKFFLDFYFLNLIKYGQNI